MDNPAFDPVAVDALNMLYDVGIGYLVKDDDPDPNDIQSLHVASKLGAWEAKLNGDHWEIEGLPVGPNLQQSLNFYMMMHASDPIDLRKHQGPNVRQGYELPGWSV